MYTITSIYYYFYLSITSIYHCYSTQYLLIISLLITITNILHDIARGELITYYYYLLLITIAIARGELLREVFRRRETLRLRLRACCY